MTSAPATDVRQQLPDGTHIDVAFCAGKLVRREHDGIRRHMLDYVVVSVVEGVAAWTGVSSSEVSKTYSATISTAR